MVEPLRHRQTKGAETDMPSLPPPRHIPTLPERRLELRIGVNLGDVIIDGDDIFGDGVNVAARLEALAQPGTVCISQTVYDQVRNKLDLAYRPLGNHRVKNIAEPVRAYAVGVPAGIPRPRRGRRPLIIAIAGIAALIVAGLVAWAVHLGAGIELFGLGPAKAVDVASLTAPTRLAGRPSVAVLPFKNLSGDAGQEFFSDGITEDVITALGRFSNLLVIAKSASFPFKGSSASPAQIGRVLDARYLVEGSIRRAGDRLRVNAELTEAATGVHVWSETYDAEVKDVFAVQDDIARRVVGAAAVKLTRFERERILAKPTNSLAAYEYVLQGREFLSHPTRDQNDEAQKMFQRAIDLDPNYAAAYTALGEAYYETVVSGWTEFREDAIERAESLAQKALALDPVATRAYRLLSTINMYKRRYDLALGQIDRALEINPSDAENYWQRGNILVWAGKAEEALPWLEGVLRFDRVHTLTSQDLCIVYYFLRRYSEAVEAGDRALARGAGRSVQTEVHPFLAAAYAQNLSPLFDVQRFAAQFGTQEARDHILEGLTKAGFR